MKWWPHNQPKLTSAPVVVYCCLFIGAAVAFTPGLTAKDRLIAALAGPALFFSFGWFTVSLVLRVVGQLQLASIGVFYLGFIGVVIGLALFFGRFFGLALVASEEMALEALQVAGAVGVVVAAKQALERRVSPDIADGAR